MTALFTPLTCITRALLIVEYICLAGQQHSKPTGASAAAKLLLEQQK